MRKRRTLKKSIKSLEDLIKVQTSHGNWDYDPYMMGLANGLLIAMSILTGKNPDFMSAPKKWLKNRSKMRKSKWRILP